MRVNKQQPAHRKITPAQYRAMQTIDERPTKELNVACQVYLHVNRRVLGALVRRGFVRWFSGKQAWKLTARGLEELDKWRQR